MKVKELSRDGKGKITVEVAVDEAGVEKALSKIYRQVANEVNIPGFRKGKAPKRLLIARIGQEVFNKEACDLLVREGFEHAVTELMLEPLGVDVGEYSLEPGKPFVFSIDVEVPPDVELKRYKGVPVEKVPEEADEEMIKAEVDALRENYAKLEPTDGPLEPGLFAIIDYSATVDDKPFEGGTAEGALVELGGNQLLPGFEENLKGMDKGEQKQFELEFPKDYGSDEIKGKTAIFDVTIREIKNKILPEVDDDFAKELGKYETIAELRDDITERLNTKLSANAKKTYQNSVIERIVTESNVEVPEKMVDKFLDEDLEEQERAFTSRFPGGDFDSFLSWRNMDREMFKKEIRPSSEARAAGELVLAAVVKAENITVTEEEENEDIALMAEGMKQSPAKVRKLLVSRGNMPVLRKRITFRKAAELIVNEAEYTEAEKEEKKGKAKKASKTAAKTAKAKE